MILLLTKFRLVLGPQKSPEVEAFVVAGAAVIDGVHLLLPANSIGSMKELITVINCRLELVVM